MDKTLNLKVSHADLLALKELAWANRCTMSDLMRMGMKPYIKAGHELLGNTAKPEPIPVLEAELV